MFSMESMPFKNYKTHNVYVNHGVYVYFISNCVHYKGVIISAMASLMTGVSIVYTTVCSAVDERKRQSSASLAIAMEIHWWLVNYPHKGPATRKMLSFDDIMIWSPMGHHQYQRDVMPAIS